MESNNIIQVKQADMLQAIDRAEIDIQIATAKQYPRNIDEVLNKIETYATLDQETASDCFYVLRRKNADGTDNVIEGLSVRMAEIIAGAWGNLRVQTRIIGNDGRQITAQAMCHDLEANFAISKEVKRSIVTKKGYTFSEDMQVVTGNAASSIAFRNAVLTVIPKAITKKIIQKVKEVAMGQAIDLEQSRQNVIQYYAKLGVKKEQLFQYLGIKTIDEIDKKKIFELRATANAIKEGTTTVQETFIKPALEAKAAAAAQKEQTDAKSRAAAAIARSTGAASAKKPVEKPVQQTETGEMVDPETGEIILQPEQPTQTSSKKPVTKKTSKEGK